MVSSYGNRDRLDLLPVAEDSDDTGIGARFKYPNEEAQSIHPFDGATDCHETYKSATASEI